MSISISTRPLALSWSRNRIYNTFFYTLPSPGDRLFVQLQDANTLATITEVDYPLDSTVTSGSVAPELSHLMNPMSSYVRPSNLTAGITAQNIEQMTTNIKTFKVRYRAAPPTYPISWIQDGTTQFVIKGGIGDMSFANEELVNLGGSIILPRSSNFLTWVPGGRFQAPDEWGWLLYLSLVADTQRVQYQVFYLDGTQATFTRTWPVIGSNQYQNWYIPTGVVQAGLDPTNIGVRLVNITVTKFDIPSGTWVYIDNYVINIDTRMNYNAFTLYYRNSMGGWDQIRHRGDRESSSDAERKESTAPYPRTNGANPYYEATLRPKWKLNTGYISKAHLAALDDVLLSKECAVLYNGQWLPVRITSKSLTPISTKDNLANTVIEFESAGSFTSLPKQLSALR